MGNQYRHHRIHQTLWMDYITTRGNQPHSYLEVWNISPPLVSFQQEGRTPVRWRFAERNGFQVRTPTTDGWCHVLHTLLNQQVLYTESITDLDFTQFPKVPAVYLFSLLIWDIITFAILRSSVVNHSFVYGESKMMEFLSGTQVNMGVTVNQPILFTNGALQAKWLGLVPRRHTWSHGAINMGLFVRRLRSLLNP